ncbi:hypothetical protein, partial [Burkholderia sp. Ac-20365]|uniref:hypothetical protein n=1 Tax=Burkholderia sp. Ac-20365 TaxID=2703897 RepID=UPI00197BE8D7
GNRQAPYPDKTPPSKAGSWRFYGRKLTAVPRTYGWLQWPAYLVSEFHAISTNYRVMCISSTPIANGQWTSLQLHLKSAPQVRSRSDARASFDPRKAKKRRDRRH